MRSFKKKDFKNTAIICYKILSIDPNHFDSISLLATISAVKGDYVNAKELIISKYKEDHYHSVDVDVKIDDTDKTYLKNLKFYIKEGRKLPDLIEGTKVDIIDNCGHMMLLEEADRVLKVLKSFITTNYPSKIS